MSYRREICAPHLEEVVAYFESGETAQMMWG